MRLCAFALCMMLTGIQVSEVAARQVRIDGSSTVYPITNGVKAYFLKFNKDVSVDLAISGTGGGFERFAKGQIDIANASRVPKRAEIDAMTQNGVRYYPIPVAFDGISIVVSKENTFAQDITVAELKRLWEPGSQIKTWKDIRVQWPARPIKLYGPGHSSGTYDYFAEAVVGQGATRDDYVASEDDEELVQDIINDPNGMAFFGFSYYSKHKDELRALAIDSGRGPVMPSFDSIAERSYLPLSRTLYIYVNRDSLEKTEVKEFVAFYLKMAYNFTRAAGYVPYPPKHYTDVSAGLSGR